MSGSFADANIKAATRSTGSEKSWQVKMQENRSTIRCVRLAEVQEAVVTATPIGNKERTRRSRMGVRPRGSFIACPYAAYAPGRLNGSRRSAKRNLRRIRRRGSQTSFDFSRSGRYRVRRLVPLGRMSNGKSLFRHRAAKVRRTKKSREPSLSQPLVGFRISSVIRVGTTIELFLTAIRGREAVALAATAMILGQSPRSGGGRP